MKDYLKCVWVNKATLWSYIIMIFAVIVAGILITLSIDGLLVFWVLTLVGGPPAVLNSYTHLGWGTTLTAYNRTKEHIQEFGRVDQRFARSIDTAYCYRVGFELAVREAGITVSL